MLMYMGVLLLAVCMLAGWFSTRSRVGAATGAQRFLPAWIGASAVNLWYWVNHRGSFYLVTQDEPIPAARAAVPAALALLAAWHFSRA